MYKLQEVGRGGEAGDRKGSRQEMLNYIELTKLITQQFICVYNY